MTDVSKVVTITTSTGTIDSESGGDIKVLKNAAFSISVAKGKYIKSITYTIKASKNGELTFKPTDANKVTSSDNLTYTYNYSDNKLSTVTATNSANKGGIQVTSIKVVYGTIPTENKYKVSATAGAGGSVSIKNGSSEVTSGTEVEANTSLTFTATPNDGYEFVNWTDASNKEVSTNATYTTTVSAAIALTANFKAKTPVDPTESGVKPVFLESFKGITINLHQDSKNRTITVPLIHDGEDVSSYFKYTYTITPTGNTSNVTGSTLNFTPKTAGTYTVTVSATPDSDGTNDYSDVYDNPEPITFTLKVDIKYQTISVTPDPTSIKMDAGTTRVAPDLTVKTETTTLDDTEYNTLWFSTSPGIVKVDAKTGKIEAVSEGTANIRVVVTGENLESTTALITIDVDDPAVYRVHANEEYKSQKTMWNQDENLSVTLGGWLFPNDVTNLWTTKESLSSTVEWNYDNTQKNYNSRKLHGRLLDLIIW